MHSEAAGSVLEKRRETDVIQRSGSTPLSIPVASLDATPTVASAGLPSGACIDETANDRGGASWPRRHPLTLAPSQPQALSLPSFLAHGPSVQTRPTRTPQTNPVLHGTRSNTLHRDFAFHRPDRHALATLLLPSFCAVPALPALFCLEIAITRPD